MTVGLRDEAIRMSGGRALEVVRPSARALAGLAAPLALLAAGVVGIWLASGVEAHQMLLFAGYQLGYVAIPGWVAYRALLPGDSLARVLIFGWVLGYAIEITFYVVTSAAHVPGAYAYYPLLLAPLVPLAVRGVRSPLRIRAVSPIVAWCAASVGLLALAYVGLSYFARTPLPWDVTRVSYDTDIPFALSLAGEALHHWPMHDPNVSGLPVYYYVAAHVDIAATSRVTSLPLALVLFRFAIVPLVLLVVAQLVLAGRLLLGRAAVGVLAAALLLLVGEFDPEPWYSFPFLGYLFLDVWLSPTFLVGLVFFLATIVFVAELLRDGESLRSNWRRWAAVVVFITACGASKPPTVAVIAGGLLLFLLWRWWVSRRVDRNAAAALAIVAVVTTAFYAAVYRHSALGLGVHPLGSFATMGWVHDARAALGDAAGWPIGVGVGTLALFGPQLAGVVALLAVRRGSLDATRVFLLGLLLAGLAPFFLLHQGGSGEVYFSHYGTTAGVLLAAEGIALLAARWSTRAAARTAAAIFAATFGLVTLVVYAITVRFSLPGPSLPALHARGVACLFALAAAFVLVWRWGSPARRLPLLGALYAGSAGILLALWRLHWNTYLPHAGFELGAALVAGTVAAMLVVRGALRRELALGLVVLIAALGALDVPLDHGPHAIDRVRGGHSLSDTGRYGLSRGLYRGLTWIRENTPTDSVLAVNNYKEGGGTPTNFYYSAFSERRVFLEGWLFTAASWNILGPNALTSKRVPFPGRLTLNKRVFDRADRSALATLERRYGVRYLVVDHEEGHATPAVASLGTVRFHDPAVTVVEVGAT